MAFASPALAFATTGTGADFEGAWDTVIVEVNAHYRLYLHHEGNSVEGNFDNTQASQYSGTLKGEVKDAGEAREEDDRRLFLATAVIALAASSASADQNGFALTLGIAAQAAVGNVARETSLCLYVIDFVWLGNLDSNQD